MIDWSGVIISIVNAIMRIILAAFTLWTRKAFHEKYPLLGKFYDYITVGFALYAISKLLFLPLNLDRAGIILLNKDTARLLNTLANAVVFMFTLIFLYAWVSLIRTLTKRYVLIPSIVEFPGTTKKDIPSGLYLCGCHETPNPEIYELLKGRAGVIISRRPPEVLREQLKLKKVPILWLTKVEGDNHVHPRRLEYLIQNLVDFMKKDNKPKFIVIDGLEYLIIENGFESIFKFLTLLKDYSVFDNTIILVPVNEKTLKSKEYSLLKREFPTLEEFLSSQKG
ncbi:hypothetical protein PAP_06665 [Palaeococcus pacificus DY20341]|uniref:DUF835 domain-containing protein n=1 Tax=Palaeococcus pacificus DY20341 TaxID=1343739 RepID=A0A075LYT1_9EURY|nr:DUF835 domain-containing protein [Palaeococcus pacificus]AIF69728.1 hypothetical protein PAP_06665 [Palaeococcus pacificus DY20341]